jgi:hypothetical protein
MQFALPHAARFYMIAHAQAYAAFRRPQRRLLYGPALSSLLTQRRRSCFSELSKLANVWRVSAWKGARASNERERAMKRKEAINQLREIQELL